MVKVDIVLAAKLYNNYHVVAVLCFYCFSSKKCDALFSIISWLICHGLLPQTCRYILWRLPSFSLSLIDTFKPSFSTDLGPPESGGKKCE